MAAKPAWTKDKPKKAGWYVICVNQDKYPTMLIEVHNDLDTCTVFGFEAATNISGYEGIWYGPIQAPPVF